MIRFVAAACNSRPGGSKEYLVVTELCPGGTLAEVLRARNGSGFSPEEVCSVFWQVTKPILKFLRYTARFY